MMEQGPPKNPGKMTPEQKAHGVADGRRVVAVLLVLFISPFLLFWGTCAMFAAGSGSDGMILVIVVPLLGIAAWIMVSGARALWQPKATHGGSAVAAIWILAALVGIAYVAAIIFLSNLRF